MLKNTFKGSKRKKLKKSGFRARNSSVSGKKILRNRRNKKRKNLISF